MRHPTFTQFAATIGLSLTAGQRVLSTVAFDGVDPGRLDGADRDLARQMFGDVDAVPPLARRTLCLTLGRGSGKTTLAAAYGLHRMLSADCSRLGPGDIPHVVVIAPTTRTAKLAVGMARELVAWSPALRGRVEQESTEGFHVRRTDGRRVAFAAFPASRGGAAARGLSVLSLILDEAQFFASGGEYVVTDRDVFGAIVPRLMPGGAAVFISTPWPVPTLMAELAEKNLGAPTTALAAKASTLLMRDNDEQTAQLVASERERDSDNAAREFDCDDSATAGASLFFAPDAIKAAVDESIVLPYTTAAGIPPIHFGSDLAFSSDSSTLAGVSEEREDCPHLLVELEELRPGKGKPLRPSAVLSEFAEIIVRRSSGSFHADAHYRETAREHLDKSGIEFVDLPGGQSGKVETYLHARKVLHEGRLLIPNHARLIAQLRAVTSKPGPRGGTVISSPRRTGLGHGDLVSATVAAIWAARNGASGLAMIARWLERQKREQAAQGNKQRVNADGWPIVRTKSDMKFCKACNRFVISKGAPWCPTHGPIVEDPWPADLAEEAPPEEQI